MRKSIYWNFEPQGLISNVARRHLPPIEQKEIAKMPCDDDDVQGEPFHAE